MEEESCEEVFVRKSNKKCSANSITLRLLCLQQCPYRLCPGATLSAVREDQTAGNQSAVLPFFRQANKGMERLGSLLRCCDSKESCFVFNSYIHRKIG